MNVLRRTTYRINITKLLLYLCYLKLPYLIFVARINKGKSTAVFHNKLFGQHQCLMLRLLLAEQRLYKLDIIHTTLFEVAQQMT